MKTFIIDWGKEANGGQFALIQADTIENAWDDADMIGSPEGITVLNIKKIDVGGADARYMEIADVSKPFTGKGIKASVFNTWKSSCEMFKRVYG